MRTRGFFCIVMTKRKIRFEEEMQMVMERREREREEMGSGWKEGRQDGMILRQIMLPLMLIW